MNELLIIKDLVTIAGNNSHFLYPSFRDLCDYYLAKEIKDGYTREELYKYFNLK